MSTTCTKSRPPERTEVHKGILIRNSLQTPPHACERHIAIMPALTKRKRAAKKSWKSKRKAWNAKRPKRLSDSMIQAMEAVQSGEIGTN